jgi:hypothetical protein
LKTVSNAETRQLQHSVEIYVRWFVLLLKPEVEIVVENVAIKPVVVV